MNFLNILKSKKENSAPTGWENMAGEGQNIQGQEAQPSPEQQNIRRQQNKLIAYFVTNDLNNMKVPNVEISRAVEERYFEGVLNGSITKEQEDRLLTSLASPISLKMNKGETYDGACRSIYQELGLQSYFLARAINSRVDDEASGAKAIDRFVNAYPLPSDFDEAEGSLKRTLKNEGLFSDQQIDYCFNSIRNAVYGKRQQYQDRINELHLAAHDYKIQKNLRWQQGAEIERNPGFNAGAFGISEQEARSDQLISYDGEASRLYEQSSKDAYYMDKQAGVFAVFDGVNSSPLGKTASSTCKEIMPSQIINNADDIVTTFAAINDAVCKVCGNRSLDKEFRGATTATIVKLSEDHRTLSCASIGDSRAYLIRDGKAELLTKDDGEGNVINKFIGDISFHVGKVSRENIITRSVLPGDRILLCTDGITGDKAPDLMSNETIATIVSNSTTEEAAKFLTRFAKKKDDRTAIVIEV